MPKKWSFFYQLDYYFGIRNPTLIHLWIDENSGCQASPKNRIYDLDRQESKIYPFDDSKKVNFYEGG